MAVRADVLAPVYIGARTLTETVLAEKMIIYLMIELIPWSLVMSYRAVFTNMV